MMNEKGNVKFFLNNEPKMYMKEFSVCYDKFCIGRFTLTFDEGRKVMPFEGLGAFKMYLLGMWNDGMVVTMIGYDEEAKNGLSGISGKQSKGVLPI